MPAYSFLSQFCGYFVHAFLISLYLKEIVLTCVVYATNVYHKSEYDIHGFSFPESCCDSVTCICALFQVLGQLVIHIPPLFGAGHTPIFLTSLCKLYLSMNYFGIM